MLGVEDCLRRLSASAVLVGRVGVDGAAERGGRAPNAELEAEEDGGDAWVARVRSWRSMGAGVSIRDVGELTCCSGRHSVDC